MPVYSASFQVPEDGFDHSETMPEVPAPDTLPTLRERFEEMAGENDRLADKAREARALGIPESRWVAILAPSFPAVLPPWTRW